MAQAIAKGAIERGVLSPQEIIASDPSDENRGVFGINMLNLWDLADELNDMMKQIVALCGDGTFDPVVDKTFPFEEAGAAHQYIQDRKNFGKVVLTTGT